MTISRPMVWRAPVREYKFYTRIETNRARRSYRIG